MDVFYQDFALTNVHTVVTILININLNIFEQYVVSGALLDIAVTSQNMV